MGTYIHPALGYHVGDPHPDGLSAAVPERPSENHSWGSSKWTLNLPSLKTTELELVKVRAGERIADLDNDVDKAAVRTTLAPFRTQFGNATTKVQVEQAKADALAAIEAL